jgi:conserved oligomeric Golgi complex subunit 8
MADPLLELLMPYFDAVDASPRSIPLSKDPIAAKYLNRLSTLPLTSLKADEPQSLSHSSHSILLSLQALSNRSHKAVVAGSDHLCSLEQSLPNLVHEVQVLKDTIPKLDEEAVQFSSLYSKSVENHALDRRKKAMMLARNADRLSDILDLPTLLSTAVSSSSASSSAGSSNTNYSAALDLFAHIRRLQILYPNSSLIRDVSIQAEEAMKDMTTNLIASLRVQNIRLAAAMRTVGWLRRVAPELDFSKASGLRSSEGAFGALFLVCRLANLVSMLEALEPLRELADQESQKRLRNGAGRKESASSGSVWSGGQQTERYLKRYIEIFREQSFAIVSLFRNIFPTTVGESTGSDDLGLDLKSLKLQTKLESETKRKEKDPLLPLPSALATFPMHLVDLLTETLRAYLPNVQERGSRESLLTQVLYCAGSLGRLGGDFSMILADLDEEDDLDGEGPTEWEEVMKKHRVLAGRLELMASGGAVHDSGRKASRGSSSGL